MRSIDSFKTFLSELEKANDYISASDLVHKLGVSVRTIYNYEDRLNEVAIPLGAQVLRDRNKGLKLQGPVEARRQIHKQIFKNEAYSVEERRKEIFEDMIMNDQRISIRKLEEKYFVTKNSIIKDLEILEDSLKGYDLYLEKGNSGTILCGLEQNVRNIKRNYIYKQLKEYYEMNNIQAEINVKTLLEKYFDLNHIFISKQMIEFLNEHLEVQILEDYYNQLLVEMCIFLQRISFGHFLTQTRPRPVVTELHYMATYPVTVELCGWLEANYGLDIPKIEIRWLNARISGNYHEHQHFDLVKDNTMVNSILTDMISMVSEIIGEDLTGDQILTDGLRIHLVPMIIRITNKVKIINPFLNQIKHQYSSLFSVLYFAIRRIEENLKIYVSDDEISFILIHFQSAIERKNLSKTIAIITKENQMSTDLIVNRVKRFLPRFDVLEVFFMDEFDIDYLENFDYIISTENVKFEGKMMVKISRFVTEEDIKNIQDLFHRNRISSKQDFKNLQWFASKGDLLYLQGEWESKNVLLDDIVRYLEKNESVDEAFFQTVIDRENISSTEIMNNVALPHGSPHNVKKDTIVFVNLDKPVFWGTQNVNLVICLAINYSCKEKSVNLVKSLYHIIKDQELLGFIRMCKSKEDLFELISTWGS